MPEELLARLQNLENSYYGDKEQARQKSFFDTYGSRFSNNRGLGLAILNELDARGIDTSAADEAVTEILDTLRTQCNEIIESIKGVQDQAIDTARKVETIQNVVSEAAASNPESDGADAVPPVSDEMAVPPDPALEEMNPDGEFNPDEVPPEEDMAGMPPEEPPMPPAEEPNPAVETPVEEPNPDRITSDIRTKRVNRMKANWKETRAQREAKSKSDGTDSKSAQDDSNKQSSWKPTSGILGACGGN